MEIAYTAEQEALRRRLRDYYADLLHRYFLCAEHLELTLGGATTQLLRLGSLLAGDAA